MPVASFSRRRKRLIVLAGSITRAEAPGLVGRILYAHPVHLDTPDMRDVITVYDTEKHQLAGKVRRLADLRGEGVSMNDVVRDHLAPAVDAELREWDRVKRGIERMSEMDVPELEARENKMLDRINRLSPAEIHFLDQIQAELDRRSTPSVG